MDPKKDIKQKKSSNPMKADQNLDLPLDLSDLEQEKPDWLGGTETEEKFWSHTE